MVIGRVDDQSLDTADVAVACVDVLAAPHLHVAQRHAVAGDHLLAGVHAAGAQHAQAAHADPAHAQPPTESVVGPREHLSLPVAPLSSRVGQELGLLGVLERVELGGRAAQPDLLPRRVDEIDRHQATRPAPVLRRDDEVGERLGDGIDDDARQLPADAVAARDVASDRELRACRS